jgi:hypothetical protein
MLRTLTILLILTAPLPAARLALLIGIADYDPINNNAGFRRLNGPVNDVSALEKTLREKWQFTDIRKLLNRDATRANILNAIDNLATRAKAGDFIFIYFSGHGTSGLDRNASYGFGMERSTGAIVPWDMKKNPTPREALDGLIIAARDLRPRLSKLDSRAQVFAVFDACYSGNSIKAIPVAGLTKRDGDIAPSGPGRSAFLQELGTMETQLSDSVAQNPYPYKQLMYLSASAASEPAWDIGPDAIAGGRRTVDGQAHGAMTSALLEALNGKATGGDGVMTYNSLHQFVTRTVEGQFSQAPQLVYDTANPKLASGQVFGGKAPAAPPGDRGHPFRVKFAKPEPAIENAIRNAPNLEIAQREYDVQVERDHDGNYSLRHTSGLEILNEPSSHAQEFAAAIRGLARSKELADLQFPGQTFRVDLDLLPDEPPAEREVFYGDEKMYFRMSPEKKSWLLLVNIDRKGYVSVIYPWVAGDVNPVTGSVNTTKNQVQEPFGLEVMKVVAFEQAPAGIERFVAHEPMAPGSPDFEALLKLVRTAPGSKAEYVRLLYSNKGPKPVN